MKESPPLQYEVLVAHGDIDEMLEQAYAMSNKDGRPLGRQVPATTPGDMLLLDGQHYLVEHQGFHKLNERQARSVKRLGCMDAWRGYHWLVRSRLI